MYPGERTDEVVRNEDASRFSTSLIVRRARVEVRISHATFRFKSVSWSKNTSLYRALLLAVSTFGVFRWSESTLLLDCVEKLSSDSHTTWRGV